MYFYEPKGIRFISDTILQTEGHRSPTWIRIYSYLRKEEEGYADHLS